MRLHAAGFADLDPATLYALIRLRLDVFVVDQGCVYQDLDGRDAEPDTLHLWLAPDSAAASAADGLPVAAWPAVAGEPAGAAGPAPLDGSAPVAYLRILREPDGSGRVGRVCTAVGHRGRGLAGDLVREALHRLGDRPCVMSAQSHLAGFYGRLGFVVTGADFIEDGIPHTPMRRIPTGLPPG
jgi:ElaA protein